MIGINAKSLRGTLAKGRKFVSDYNLTFTNLLDDSSGVYRHYGSPYTSHYWLLDKEGNRVGSRTESFSTAGVQGKLDSLSAK